MGGGDDIFPELIPLSRVAAYLGRSEEGLKASAKAGADVPPLRRLGHGKWYVTRNEWQVWLEGTRVVPCEGGSTKREL